MNTTRRLELRIFDRLAQVLGLSSAGLGVVSLLGWILGYPFLSTFGADLIPMAPSTSLLFVVSGVMLFFSSRSQYNRQLRLVAVFILSIVFVCRSRTLLPFAQRDIRNSSILVLPFPVVCTGFPSGTCLR